jgi:hypothetical protein
VLQKAFIVATLASTVIGTFTTGINLYERVGEKRKQLKKDTSQDDRIKELEKQVKEKESKSKAREEDVKTSLVKSGPMIQNEYDQNFQRLGPKFAQGDGTWRSLRL